MKIRHYYLHCHTGTALHVGANVGGSDVSDSMFRRNAAGNLVLPGTSIAGALRSHLTRIIPAMSGLSESQTVCESLVGTEDYESPDHILYHLMGDLQPDRTINIRASRLIVNDSLLEPPETHIRDGVGIDRISGAASRQGRVKFDMETIPAGTPLIIILELEDYDDMDEYLVYLALYEWQQGRIRFGGNTARGLGVLNIDQIEIVEYDLSEPVQLMAYLRREKINVQVDKSLPPPARYPEWFGPYRQTVQVKDDKGQDKQLPFTSMQHWVEFRFDLQAEGFFLTNDMTKAGAKGLDHFSTPFLPGSGLRGVIRSHAERLARTIANLNASDQTEFLERCSAADPFVMFWTQHEGGLEATVSRIQRSNLDTKIKLDPDIELFDLSEQLFGTTLHGSRLLVDDAALQSQVVWKKLDFVAIDRFTGGAADKMKFDAYALWQPCFTCRLYLESPQAWEIGWLIQVLQDMQAGVVPVGFGAAKGFGDVRLENLNITLGYVHPEALPGLVLPAVGEAFFTEEPLNNDQMMMELVKQWRNTAVSFRVHTAVPYQTGADPYWGSEQIVALYPREGGF